VEVKGPGLSSGPGPDGRVSSTSRYAAPLSATAGRLADSIRTLWAERALAWLKGQEGIRSLSFLNSFGVGGPGAAFTKDMPTKVFSRVGENFLRSLRGEIVWDASTSPVF
jgi:hypothetical protein